MSENESTVHEHEPTRPARTPEGVRQWLTGRVAFYLKMTPDEVDPRFPLADYGLDSVYAFTLCAEIEDTLDVPIEPASIWDIDTLAELTEHVMGLLAAEAAR